MMQRRTTQVEIPSVSIGQRRFLTFHHYGDTEGGSTERAYIQASLHADEIPGLLVNHHLIKLLDEAAAQNKIKKSIVIVPYANPVGLTQQLLGNHVGRFNLDSGLNFNRDWPDFTEKIASQLQPLLKVDDAAHNVKTIRDLLVAAIDDDRGQKEDNRLRKILFRVAATSDIVLDLHCDSDAVMHMYTHDRLWPQMSDLASELQSECNIISGNSGGNPFDEACSCLWSALADRFPGYPIPMACQSVTVELRGEAEVYDDLAYPDAQSIFRFLQRRGYIEGAELLPPHPLRSEAVPLNGVDMIEAPVAGVVAWRVRPGAMVAEGALLGEIVNIEDPDAERIPVTSRTAGLVFGVRTHKLVRPGQIIIKVAGSSALEWRKGNLLTAK